MQGVWAGRTLDDVRAPYPLRVHQQEAIDAVGKAMRAGSKRAWVVLPPGAGKTLVGLETARRRGHKTVVFGPNTAVQSQWARGWDSCLAQDSLELRARANRELDGFFTALTYQSLATFRPDSEVDEEGEERPLLVRLHPNGQELVDRLRKEPELTIVLDECHHLVEVWGRLLKELLEGLPNAFVLGLTATPPDSLTQEQTELVDDLFGETVYTVSVPALVREGDLAPFGELAWLTTPTPKENDWLGEQSERFLELVNQLTDPAFGSVPFFEWIHKRFVKGSGDAIRWHRLAKNEPALTDAALRMSNQGLMEVPAGARLREEHRHSPTADDWVLLLDDWLRTHVARSTRLEDLAVVEAVRRALPSVGYHWTRRGIRRGRSPVDRVLARSAAKTDAVVEIVNAEHRNLGTRLRMLVLCDHEYATAVLPADLSGVMSQQAGSAHLTVERLIEDAGHLSPMLVTGGTVAGSPSTLQRLIEFIRADDPALAAQIAVAWPNAEVTGIHGSWKSRQWVPWVTRFFEEGHCNVLVGTRGLLGEGWDARAVTGLVDLTAATTIAAVVQTRGRALRTHPEWPEKVALTWSVVCVSEDHPKGANDWQRFVRKHAGFYGVDRDGDVVSGVAHVDPLFSPYAPPDAASFDEVNARMLLRSEQRDAIRNSWRVGEGYDDEVVHTVRLVPQRRMPRRRVPPAAVMRERAIDVRETRPQPWRPHPLAAAALLVVLVGGLLSLTPTTVALLGMVAATGIQAVFAASRGRALVLEASRPASLEQVACAVADGLRDAELSPRGAEAVRVEVDAEGEYRCALYDVPEAISGMFATALDEVVSPMGSPRYVVPRWVVDRPTSGLSGYVDGLKASLRMIRPTGEVWHTVPTVLGVNARSARAFARAWDTWVGGGPALYTGTAEGEGVLVTHRGSDPFATTTVLRVHWR